jgi:hypothetical protein
LHAKAALRRERPLIVDTTRKRQVSATTVHVGETADSRAILACVDTATVSVIASGVVGLGGLTVPVITTRMTSKQGRITAYDARIDELREVIDEAAVTLMAVREAEPQLEEVEEGFERVRRALPRLRAALMKVWQQEARLSARLGIDSEIVVLYGQAHQALGELHTYWSRVVDGETPHVTFEEANSAIPSAIAAFFAAASARVGPDRENPAS